MSVKPMDIDELAQVLRRKSASLASDLVRKPASVPPHFKVPGTRKPLWLPSTVDQWILDQARRANALPGTKK